MISKSKNQFSPEIVSEILGHNIKRIEEDFKGADQFECAVHAKALVHSTLILLEIYDVAGEDFSSGWYQLIKNILSNYELMKNYLKINKENSEKVSDDAFENYARVVEFVVRSIEERKINSIPQT